MIQPPRADAPAVPSMNVCIRFGSLPMLARKNRPSSTGSCMTTSASCPGNLSDRRSHVAPAEIPRLPTVLESPRRLSTSRVARTVLSSRKACPSFGLQAPVHAASWSLAPPRPRWTRHTQPSVRALPSWQGLMQTILGAQLSELTSSRLNVSTSCLKVPMDVRA